MRTIATILTRTRECVRMGKSTLLSVIIICSVFIVYLCSLSTRTSYSKSFYLILGRVVSMFQIFFSQHHVSSCDVSCDGNINDNNY